MPDDKTKKSLPRNRELERLGVVVPAHLISDSRRQCTVKNSNDKKSEALPDSNTRISADGKSSASVTDADESSASETDTDQGSMSEEDVSDDNETDDVVTDSDNEVIIVSEVKGKNSSHDGVKSLEKKSGSDRGSASKVVDGFSAAASVPFKKPLKQVAAQSRPFALHDGRPESSSSSWWVHKVNVLETTMSEMKAKFAEVLRQKVSIDVPMMNNETNVQCREIKMILSEVLCTMCSVQNDLRYMLALTNIFTHY